MRIKTLLQTSGSVALLILLALAVANWYISARLIEVSHTQERAQATAHDVSELLVLTHEYAMYSEERAAQQWVALQAVLKR